jgi:hypothetical protein
MTIAATTDRPCASSDLHHVGKGEPAPKYACTEANSPW